MQNEIIKKIETLLDYTQQKSFTNYPEYSADEVNQIIEQEAKLTRFNYLSRIKEFQRSNLSDSHSGNKKFVVFWGYPGAGKSFMVDKLIKRHQQENPDILFNIIDKDQHRDIFGNLFEHLRGHVEECEKFGRPAMEYVRQILNLTLDSGRKSVISIGAMGAGSEFCDNASTAIDNGYKAQAVYMCVNPDVAYLSNVYRCCTLYDKMIHQGQELYPRLVSRPYFDGVQQKLDGMILQIDAFQKQNPDNVELLVVNRANQTIYDSQQASEQNVLGKIHFEENRLLSSNELILINKQISLIDTNIRHRCENNIYYPSQKEIAAMQTALSNIESQVVKTQAANTLKFFLLNDRKEKAV